MSKPKLVVTHPRDWAVSEYGKQSGLDVHHVYIGGNPPKKTNGNVTFDGYADVATPGGKKELYSLFKRLKPELFLFWIHVNIQNDYFKALKTVSPKTKFVHWFGNHRFSFPTSVKRFQPFLSAVAINSEEPSQYDMYKRHGIKHVFTLWDGFQPDEAPLKDIEPEYDCIFGGNSYLSRARAGSPGLNFPGGLFRYNLIMGCRKRFNTAVMSDSQRGWPFECLDPAYHPEYTNLLRRGKITLNVNHFPTFKKAYTRRTIRSIFCGRMHITLYIPGMEDDFENHKHLVWYHKTEEAFELIEHYLKHEDERERIAAAGLKLAKEKFTFEQRLKQFEKDVEVLL